jgi:DNA-binding CsgD family transcriptional regulator/tetratricopeptide (TPR) repeat protein
LTRRAIVDSVPVARAIELNRRVLAALAGREGADLSRIVHHAAGAGDLDAIARYGPEAASEAARAGAHREAAAHYRLVLQQRDRFPPDRWAALLEAYAVECYTIGAAHRAVAAQRDAVELRRAMADPRALGASLRWLSRMHWWAGDRTGAESAAEQASAVLAGAGDDRLRALAYSNRSQLHMLASRSDAAIELGERAAALAAAVGDAAILSHALTNIGLARWHLRDPAGESTLTEGLRVALAAGETEDALRAYVGMIWNLLDEVRLDEADRFLAEALALAERAEHLGFLSYLQVERARLCLARAAWDDAVTAAEAAANGQAPMMCPALTVLGRVRARRGQAGADDLLERAWRLAVEIDEMQRIGPVAAARCEAAWLRGDHAAVRAIAEPVHADARRLGAGPIEAELGHWLAAAGRPVEPPDADHPYALQAAGRWREAAAAWSAAGCPYEHAAALAASGDPDDLLAALAGLTALDAGPLAAIVRAKLRRLGVTRIPRGPYRAARDNPAGLTGRQVEVLRLLSEGLTNAEIAGRLVLSVRTVDGHVAAVFDKIGARTRREAAVRAVALGVLDAAKRG